MEKNIVTEMFDIVLGLTYYYVYNNSQSVQLKVPWTAYLATTASGLVVESASHSVSLDSMESHR